MDDLSEDMVRSLFSSTIEPLAVLVTVGADGMDAPLRFTDFNGRVGPNSLGVMSRGELFQFFPFGFAWGGAGTGELARHSTLKIGNTAGEIADGLEAATGQPQVTVEAVRVAAPDSVERAMTGAVLASAEEDGPTITGSIKPRQFDTEPACKKSFLPVTTPALF